MAADLLSEAGGGRAATKADRARVLRCSIHRTQHSRGAAAAETDAAGVGDFLGRLANDWLFGHGASLLGVFGRAANAARRSLAQKNLRFIKRPCAGNNGRFARARRSPAR